MDRTHDIGVKVRCLYRLATSLYRGADPHLFRVAKEQMHSSSPRRRWRRPAESDRSTAGLMSPAANPLPAYRLPHERRSCHCEAGAHTGCGNLTSVPRIGHHSGHSIPSIAARCPLAYTTVTRPCPQPWAPHRSAALPLSMSSSKLFAHPAQLLICFISIPQYSTQGLDRHMVLPAEV